MSRVEMSRRFDPSDMKDRDDIVREFFIAEISEAVDSWQQKYPESNRNRYERLFHKNKELAAYTFFEDKMLQGRRGLLSAYRTINPHDFTDDLKHAILDAMTTIFDPPK